MDSKPTSRSVAFSTSAYIYNKPGRGSGVDFGSGWVNVDTDAGFMVELITQGRAFSAQFDDGHRNSSNFIRAGFLAADVDEGMTLQQALQNEFVKSYATFLYTTPSHRPDAHRFRIVFVLDQEVTRGSKWADALMGLAVKLNADLRSTGAARLFFGNDKAEVIGIGSTMPPSAVDELAELGRVQRHNQKNAARRRSQEIGAISFDAPVRLASGDMAPLDGLATGTSLHCPYHDDANPSAFVVRSRTSNANGIHCRTCGASFWPSDGDRGYDFNAFERLFAQKLMEERHRIGSAPSGGFDDFFPPAPQIERLREPFLPRLSYQKGLTLVRSPKGTGKTEALKHMLDFVRSQFSNRAVAISERVRSVLLVGHRTMLLREAADRLGLQFYQNEELSERGVKTLAVCVDSLPKFVDSVGQYDLVIIDESEQVFSHLIGETIKNNNGLSKVYSRLQMALKGAKAVVALDADLGMLTTHVLSVLRQDDWERQCRIIWNEPDRPQQPRPYFLYENRTALEEDLMAAIAAGKRCFVATNSKQCVEVLAEMIRLRHENGPKVMKVTSDNSREPHILDFVKNIRTKILDYQVVLCSPSLGTGVDITFDGSAIKIDEVYGFFQNRINTHTDIDQQLARVRHPGAVKVWVDGNPMHYISALEYVRDELGRAHFIPQAVIREEDDGRTVYDKDHPLLLIAAHVVAARKASHNRLKELFVGLRKKNGWEADIISKSGTAAAIQIAKEARGLVKAKGRKAVLDAPPLSSVEFAELDARYVSGAPLRSLERAAHHRNEIEQKLGVKLVDWVMELDQDGRLVEKVEILDTIMAFPDITESFLLAQAERVGRPEGRLRYDSLALLVGFVMRLCGLSNAHGLYKDAAISAETLGEFANVVSRNRVTIEELLGQPVRRDIHRNPVRQLNAFLAVVGLRLTNPERHKKKGVTTRMYRWDTVRLDRMLMLTENYRNRQKGRGWSERHNEGIEAG